MDKIKERINGEMIENRQVMFQNQQQNEAAANPTSSEMSSGQLTKGVQPHRQFGLGSGEDSTLHLASQIGSEPAQDKRAGTAAQRVQSAHFPSHQRGKNIAQNSNGLRNDYYSDASNRFGAEMSQSTFQRAAQIRASPVNTVFQKLANPQTMSQSSQRPSQKDFQKLINSNKNVNNQNNGGITMESQEITLKGHQQRHARVQQHQISKTSDKLLISVKPLKDDNMYSEEPEGSHNNAIHKGTRSHSREGAITLHSRGVVATFSSEDSDEDESPTVGRTMEPGTSCEGIVLVDHNQFGVHYQKDADTSPMAGAEMGTQTHAFHSQTSFPHVNENSFGQADMNFFNSGLYNQFDANTQIVDLRRAKSNNHGTETQSIHDNNKNPNLNRRQLQIPHSLIVALLQPDERLFKPRKIDQHMQSNGFDTDTYVCLQLKDLIWIHNYIIQDIVREKREVEKGRMTSQGRQERRDRDPPKPSLVRNKILEPATYKRFEGKILRKVDAERKAQTDYHRFVLALINLGQQVVGKIADKPVLSVEKLIMKPKQEQQNIQAMIKVAQNVDKQQYQILDNQFKTDQAVYSSFLAQHQHNKRQPSQGGGGAQTPPRAKKKQAQIEYGSEIYPPTLQMSQALVDSQGSGSQEQLNQIQPPHAHLSIVAKATEPRPATTSFIQQGKPKYKMRPQHRGNFKKPATGKSQGVSRTRDSNQSFLKIEQVKVNSSQEDLGATQKSGSDGAVGTQRLMTLNDMQEGTALIDNLMQTTGQSQAKVMIQGQQHHLDQPQIMPIQLQDTSTYAMLLNQQQQNVVAQQDINISFDQSKRPQSQQQAIQNHHPAAFTSGQISGNMGVIFVDNSIKVEPTKEAYNGQSTSDYKNRHIQNRQSIQENPTLIYDKFGNANQIDSNSYVVSSSNHTTNKADVTHQQFLKDYNNSVRNGNGPYSNSLAVGRKTSLESRRISASTLEPGIGDGDSSSTIIKQMDVNLQADFQEMRKFVQTANPVGVTGTRVKTFEGRPGDRILESRGYKKAKSPNVFSQIRLSNLDVHALENEKRGQSQMSQSSKKVIMVDHKDTYKQQSSMMPRWVVPTSKRVRKASQPRQSSVKRRSDYVADQNSMIYQQLADENNQNMSNSQANFYRTTRSRDLAAYNLSKTMIESGALAIDNQNTIHLQKAIDQYYDGDLSLDQLHNGDIHSMQVAASSQKDRKNSPPNAGQLGGPNESLMADGDEESIIQMQPVGDSVNVSLIWKSDGRADSQGSPSKNQLQGAKFKQAEMIGFRKIASTGSAYQKESSRTLSRKGTAREQNSSDNPEANVAIVSGHTFRGTYTVKHASEESLERTDLAEKRVGNHRVLLGTVPSQLVHYGTILQSAGNMSDNENYIHSSHLPSTVLESLRKPSDRQHTNSTEEKIKILPNTQGTLYLQTEGINKDLTPVITAEQRNEQNKLKRSEMQTNREEILSPKFRDSQSFANGEGFGGQSGHVVVGKYIGSPLTKGQAKDISAFKNSSQLPNNRTKTNQGHIEVSQNMVMKNKQLLHTETLKIKDSREYQQILAGTRVPEKYQDRSDENLSSKKLAAISIKRLESEGLQEQAAQEFVINDAKPRLGAKSEFQANGLSPIRESHSVKQLATPLEEPNVRNSPEPIQASQLNRDKYSLLFKSEEAFHTPVLRDTRSPLLSRGLNQMRTGSLNTNIGLERPQSVVLSILSASKKQNDSSEEEIDLARADIRSEKPDSSHGGLSPGAERQQFLATAIYVRDKDRHQILPETSDFAKAAAAASRSVTDVRLGHQTQKSAQKHKGSIRKIQQQPMSIHKKYVIDNVGDQNISSRSKEPLSGVRVRKKSSQILQDKRQSDSIIGLRPNTSAASKLPPSGRMVLMPSVLNDQSGRPNSIDASRHFIGESANSQTPSQYLKELPQLKSDKFSPQIELNASEGNGVNMSTAHRKPSAFKTSSQNTQKDKIKEFIQHEAKTKHDKTLEVIQGREESSGENQKIRTSRIETESENVRKKDLGDSESQREEFKLLDSDLNEEGFADQDINKSHALSTSPIRVQTKTINKSNQSLANQNFDEPNSSVIQINPNISETSIIGAIGPAAYKTEGLIQLRPIRTAGAKTRQTLKTSQVVMGPIDFSSLPQHDNTQVDIVGESDMFNIQSRPSRKQTANPYENYLNSTSAEDIDLQKFPNRGNNDSHASVTTMSQDIYTQVYRSQDDGAMHYTNTRPKTSIQSYSIQSREGLQIQHNQRQSMLLKRNMNMNRRQSELLRKGKEEKQKRFSQAVQSNESNYQPARAQTSQNYMRPNTTIYSNTQQKTNTSSRVVSGSVRMRRVLQKKNRKMQFNLQEESLISQNNNNPGEQAATVLQSVSHQQVQVANEDYYSTKLLNGGLGVQAMVSDRPTNEDQPPKGQTVIVNSSIRGNTNDQSQHAASIVVLNKSSAKIDDAGPSTVKKQHDRNNTHVLIAMQGEGISSGINVNPTAKLAMLIQQQSPAFSNEQSKSTHRINERDNSLVSSMEPIREIQDILSHNQLNEINAFSSYGGQKGSQQKRASEGQFQAAMQGQPAPGVGNEVQDKRDKIKQIYKAGRRKITMPMISTSKTPAAKRPPMGATRNQSSLGQRHNSNNNFSVQGNGFGFSGSQTNTMKSTAYATRQMMKSQQQVRSSFTQQP